MESRERVFRALSHEEPDRVPVDYWATADVTRNLISHFGVDSEESLLRRLGVDFRYIEGPSYIGPPREPGPEGSVEDHWGVPRRPVTVSCEGGETVYREVVAYPLSEARSVDDVLRYPKWPSPDWFDYSCVGDQVAKARDSGAVVVFMGDRLNRCAQLKPAMYLRGVGEILVDLVADPEIAECIFDRILHFYLEYGRRVLEAGGGDIDILMTGDDFGAQNGMLISPELWRRFLEPGFRELVQLGKRYGCEVAHHSCGSITPIIPDMIECGLDILNPLQPDVDGMERDDLKRRFGDVLSFHGSISIQKTLPFGTAEDVRGEVAERVRTLAPGGGFIFCTAHNIQADTPMENVETLFRAYHELGKYQASGRS